MKTKTELDHDFEYRNDPQVTRHLLGMIITFSLVGILCFLGIISVWVYREEIDNFLNTNRGAYFIWGILSVFGISWFIWRVKQSVE